MKPILTATLAAAFLLTATAFSPALAGVGAVDLPRLSFPDDSAPQPSQGCASPATVSPTVCAPEEN